MINAKDFRDSIVSGANNIFKHQNHINELNIFPVPDGDTGTNMCLTIMGVVENIEKLRKTASVSEIADAVSYAALRSSRGNSGVILSLLLKGFAKHLKNRSEIVANDLVTSLEIGVDNAYKAVSKPTEGTMLTVARVAAEKGRGAVEKGNNFVTVMEEICKGAREALADTPNLLPVLKKAGMVDAGGKGLCLIFEGMLSYFRDGVIVSRDINSLSFADDNKFKQETRKFDDDIRFTYCTEFIVSKFVNCNFNPEVLRKNLQKIGDCVIVMHDDEVIKTHVHSNNPDKVLSCALTYGKLINVKIDNLEEQNKQIINKLSDNNENDTQEEIKPEKALGMLAIATGKGIIELFKSLGCDEVLEGGQTLNPSAEQIANAAKRVPAKTVFIFPNNKNILMAAEQAKKLVKNRKLVIIPSRFIPQGIAAAIAFCESYSEEDNFKEMNEAMSKVKTAVITHAARDAEFGGFKIKKCDSIALLDGKLILVSKNHFESVKQVLAKFANNNCESIDVYYPSELAYIAESLPSEVKINSSIDLNFVFGGQMPGEILISLNFS